jgi:hyperosmotically inducible protein
MKHCFAVVISLTVLLGAAGPSPSEEKKGAMERFGSTVDEKVEQTKEFFSDSAITASIKRRLFQDDMVPARDIKVTVDNGVATLEGDALSEEIARRALEIAIATEGVVKVENRLSIVHRAPSKSK